MEKEIINIQDHKQPEQEKICPVLGPVVIPAQFKGQPQVAFQPCAREKCMLFDKTHNTCGLTLQNTLVQQLTDVVFKLQKSLNTKETKQ